MSSPSHHRPLSRVQEAIAVAKQETDPHKKAVLARILEQRIRLKGQEMAEQVAHERAAEANTRKAVADSASRGPSNALSQFIDTASYSASIFSAGRDFALKHPVSVGFALGACLILAPKSLIRAAIQALPLFMRIGR